MPKICNIATAVPPYKITQSEARDFAGRIFGDSFGDIDRLLPLFDNAGIDCRYFAKPVEWFEKPHSLEENNKAYIESATELSVIVVSRLLENMNLNPEQIDYIIYVNTTGLATPSIDARIINRLRLKNSIRRTPIWGLGCAGGTAGLAHAYHHALGHPEHRILVVSVELCGLTFIRDDISKSNLVASALFADGAAAALVTGDKVDSDGLEIIDTKSRFYPDSLDVMGWNIGNRGMQVVFTKRIPSLILETAHKDISEFLAEHELTLDDVGELLFHPGGAKVISAYEKALNLNSNSLHYSKEILRNYGNMSSVTVLFVIEKYLKENGHPKSGYGLISALGPGFCSESLLVKL